MKVDPRVINLEKTNAKDIDQLDILEPDWLVADISFISLIKAIPKALRKAKVNAILIALVKPQYEVGKGHVGKSGIVKNQDLHKKALDNITQFLKEEGWKVISQTQSPILGKKGNAEYLICAQKGK